MLHVIGAGRIQLGGRQLRNILISVHQLHAVEMQTARISQIDPPLAVLIETLVKAVFKLPTAIIQMQGQHSLCFQLAGRHTYVEEARFNLFIS